MLLFSTILAIDESLTKDKFIQLVIEWNQNSPYAENIISGIEWHGEGTIRYGEDNLCLDIMEYRNQNIIAVRYRKVEADGVVWNTDYVMNFNDMKMSIQLDRSYKEEALITDSKFSTPHFITMLIERGYLKTDGKLPVLREPIYIYENNLEILTDIINGKEKYCLPVVYVSKTVYNNDPVDVKWLASRLKGIAHVLVESDRKLSDKCRRACDDKNEYFGGIGAYYPNSTIGHKKFLYHKYTGSDMILLNKVVNHVIQYGISQNLDNLYTWQGVSNALLGDRLSCQRAERIAAESAKKQAEDEVSKIYETFNEELAELKSKVEELTRNNDALRYENQGLRTKLNSSESIPILYLGEEDEFYQGEIKDMILSAVEEALNNTKRNTRRADVLEDILKRNNYLRLSEKQQRKIKQLLKDYKGMSGPMRQELLRLGFEIIEEKRHYKLTYYGDGRYWTTLAKSPSENRGGKNIVSEIINGMF